MASLKDRLVDPALAANSLAPKVNALKGGQMGPMINQGRYIQNAHQIRRSNIICKVIEFPKWVESMENPKPFREAIKTFFEVHTKIDGLNKALTVEFAETNIGGAGHRQYDLTKVREEQSDITHSTPDKYGYVYRDMLSFWIRYGMEDPNVQRPLVAVIDDDVTDALPDLYCGTNLYFEPDPLHRKVLNAWLCTNMAPRLNGPDEGRKDLEAAGETVELSIGFTSLQQTNFGVVQYAQEFLDDLNRNGLNPITRKAFVTEVDADVKSTAGGYFEQADELSKEQL